MAETYQIIVTKGAKKDINDILSYLQKKVSQSEAIDARQKNIILLFLISLLSSFSSSSFISIHSSVSFIVAIVTPQVFLR